MILLTAQAERKLVYDVMRALSASAEAAEAVADVLVEADLRGHDGHGLIRLPALVNMLRQGTVKGDSHPFVERESPAMVLLNGNQSLGPLAVRKAMEAGIEHAREAGSCAVAAYNHGYVAYVGRYAELAVEAGCIAILLGKSRASVHPFGGVKALIGTNPITVGIPTAGDPLLVDLATSAASNGKILEAIHAGRSIPSDWAVDDQGRPTTDPEAAHRGALSPLGGAKGYALAMAIEVLGSILPYTAAGQAAMAGRGSRLWSMLVVVLHLPAFANPDAFRRGVSAFLADVKSSPLAPSFSEILVPGERCYRVRRERLAAGIPISDGSWRQAASICRELGIEPGKHVASSQ